MIDHGDEPGIYPCIETEKNITRAQLLLKHLQNNLPEIWMRDDAKVIQLNLELALESFREVLKNNREERNRLLEATRDPQVI